MCNWSLMHTHTSHFLPCEWQGIFITLRGRTITPGTTCIPLLFCASGQEKMAAATRQTTEPSYRSQHPKEQYNSCLQLITKSENQLDRETFKNRQSKGNSDPKRCSSVPGFDITASWTVSDIQCFCSIS